MLNQELFIQTLKNYGVDFFTGVPDSYLNRFCTCLGATVPSSKHIITANEGNAIALASGYYFATNIIPLVYMQNSGIGNAINPLLSLVDKNVYSIPMILLIGWRGEPATGDHEQHMMHGKLTPTLLRDMEIPYVIVKDNDSEVEIVIKWGVETARKNSSPVAFIVPKGVFTGEKKPNSDSNYPMSREDAIKVIIENAPKDSIYIATTGRATRELYFLREELGQGHNCDFLNVGAMGHASSIAMGIALANKNRTVICLDGDSSAIMHLGALTTISRIEVPNLVHIVLNNGAHESVGGQPSAGHLIDFTGIASNCGYNTIGKLVTTADELIYALKQVLEKKQPAFIDVRIHKGIRSNLAPLNIAPINLKQGFMNEINSNNNSKQ